MGSLESSTTRLLHSFPSFSTESPGSKERGLMKTSPCRTRCSSVSHSLHFVQLLVSALVPVHCKKRLRCCGLTETMICTPGQAPQVRVIKGGPSKTGDRLDWKLGVICVLNDLFNVNGRFPCMYGCVRPLDLLILEVQTVLSF